MSRLLIASLLLSSSVFSASAMASAPSSDVSTPISTAQYVAPHLLSPVALHVAANDLPEGVPANASVLLHVNVDAYGRARDIQVLRTFSPEMSFRVAEAISHARFQPATYNSQKIAAPLNLVVNVQQ